jgi:hypothetical protein
MFINYDRTDLIFVLPYGSKSQFLIIMLKVSIFRISTEKFKFFCDYIYNIYDTFFFKSLSRLKCFNIFLIYIYRRFDCLVFLMRKIILYMLVTYRTRYKRPRSFYSFIRA